METKVSRNTMIEKTIETLEEAAFIFTELADEEQPQWSEDTVTETRLSFSGEASGTMMMAATSEPLVEMAANLLGAEPDDPDVSSKKSDAFGEMLNIIGGVLVEAWFGSEAEVQLDVPKMRTLSVKEYEKGLSESMVNASLVTEEGHRIDAAVFS